MSQMPSVGADSPPPELISAAGGAVNPQDSVEGNTEHMTGGTQKSGKMGEGQGHELGVGELEGASFRVEPLRRTGEDEATMKARLLCMCPPILPLSQTSDMQNP